MNKKIKNYLLLTVLLSAALVVGYYLLMYFFGGQGSFLELYTDKDLIRDYVRSYGSLGPLVYIFLQALQVVLAPIPGEFTGAIAGMLFGGFYGFIYATAGLAIGAGIAFLIGRYLGRPVVKYLVPVSDLDSISFDTERKRLMAVLVVFLIPGFPKDAMTYLFSMGKVKGWPFFFVSQLGRIPGTVMLTYGGAAFLEKDWTVLGIVAAGTVLLLAISYFRKDRIIKWLNEPTA